MQYCVEKFAFIQLPKEKSTPYETEIDHIYNILLKSCLNKSEAMNTIIKDYNSNKDLLLQVCKDKKIFYTEFAEDSKEEFFTTAKL